jgi:Type VII secretion system ESX-1, transport TM domain B
MATKKDLVEAYSFSRRRLVTAFVSGAPGGREVEPARPGRTIVGGVALAVLLAAGAAIAGVFAPRTPDDWTSSGLIVSKETGQAYVILPDENGETPDGDGPVELRPVINITSAKLILGADAEPTLISQDTIDDQLVGEDIGILGAPASLPSPDRLIETGWTACTGDGDGIRVRVATDPDVRTGPDPQTRAGYGTVVQVGGAYYLLAEEPVGGGTPAAYKYRLPASGESGRAADNLLADLDVGARVNAPEVPRAWLNLFPDGGALDWSTFALTGLHERPSAWDRSDANVPAQARVGDVVADPSGNAVVLTTDGPAELTPFAFAVYTHVRVPGAGEPRVYDQDSLPDLDYADEPYREAHWPEDTLEQLPTDPCAKLVSDPDDPPVVRLAHSPADGFGADAVDAGRTDVTVDPGRGSYVRSATWDDAGVGEPVAIDAKGRVNPLDGDTTVELLGYADFPVPVVPDTWVKLFDAGVSLSQNLALCPPTPAGRQGGSSCA